MHIKKNKLFVIIGLAILGLVILPVTVFLFQQQQETRTRAEKTVILSFEPSSTQASPMQIPAGTTFTLDVYVDPGTNSVSFVKSEIVFDESKFELAGGFIPNRQVFSQIVEAPIATPGKLTTTLSIGSDLSKAVKAKTKIGTVALKVREDATANTTAEVGFGSGSQALAVSGNSSYDENVIASTRPAIIQVNKPQLTCGTSPTDAFLVIDKSGSMNDPAGSGGSKLASAKTAANSFVDILTGGTDNRIGLSTFASQGDLDNPLNNNFSSVKNAINDIDADGNTCIECGILKANQEIAVKKQPGVKNAVILLTDGEANVIAGSTNRVSKDTAEQRALAAALNGYNANNTIFFTVGLGQEVNSDFLQELAESTGGHYYYSPTTDQLNSIYQQISEILARGSVSGSVFNDADGNGQLGQNEAPLTGWLLQLYRSGSQAPQAITTDSTGTFSITNLCDGNYTLKQVMRDGWKQTFPSNQADRILTINNGIAVTDQVFGNQASARCSDLIDNDGNAFIDIKDATCHTDGDPDNPDSYDPTRDGERGFNTCSDSKDNNDNGNIDGADPLCHTDGDPNQPYDPNLPEMAPTSTPVLAPKTATLSVNVLLHGIGNSGDNANPTESSLSNKNPLHPKRTAIVEIFDVNNQLTSTGSGMITYSSTSGSFKGTITTSGGVPPGKYSIKLRTDHHLTRLAAGIQTLVANQTFQLPTVDLVAGDANDDNQLDILDYNLLLDCYSDLSAASNCNPDKKLSTDANDDDFVNQFDYNLFLREISTQPGE